MRRCRRRRFENVSCYWEEEGSRCHLRRTFRRMVLEDNENGGFWRGFVFVLKNNKTKIFIIILYLYHVEDTAPLLGFFRYFTVCTRCFGLIFTVISVSTFIIFHPNITIYNH